jgi:Fic family protein
MTYIHQELNWPVLTYDTVALARQLETVRQRQTTFITRMHGLGFQPQQEAILEALTAEVQQSSDIEGEHLDRGTVRSSVARRLSIEIGALEPEDRYVEGVVEIVLDATQNYAAPLSAERLYGWHRALFPAGGGLYTPIAVGQWRDRPMQVVSGKLGRQRIHFEAPEAHRLGQEMERFLEWFNASEPIDSLLKAGLVHLWFVTIHPFDDGHGRIARAIADMALARSEHSAQRFYSMSAQIRKERASYYEILERSQRGGTDVTPWMEWFLGCLDRAIANSESSLGSILAKGRFWSRLSGVPIQERQQRVLNRVLDGFEGKLTTQKWAALAKCSHDTALRDIQDLIVKGVIESDGSHGRSTAYRLRTD